MDHNIIMVISNKNQNCMCARAHSDTIFDKKKNRNKAGSF